MRRREAPSRKAKPIHIARSRVVYFFTIYLYPQNLLSPTIRDLKMLETSSFHQNVDLGSILSKYISDFENPSRKTRERNYKYCVRFERTI